MSFFLYKPHVMSPEHGITSPDILIDHVFVDGRMRPVGILTSEPWQQVAAGELSEAAYAVVALGGGALIAPAIVLSSGTIVVARSAWRINRLDCHAEKVTVNGVPLSEAGTPAELIAAAGGTGDTLPRGYMLVNSIAGPTRNAELVDPVLGQSLGFKVVLEQMEVDRWGKHRPRPRYSVGPTGKDVQHYI